MMTSEERRNAPAPDGLALLIEAGRGTAGIEATYDAARTAFIEAARELDRQRRRFDKRAAELLAAAPALDLAGITEAREPRAPEPVTAAELLYVE